MNSTVTTRTITPRRDEGAPVDANREDLQERLVLKRLRRGLLKRASGTVLEVACGTGVNFRHYPDGCAITAFDLDPEKVRIARWEAGALGLDADVRVMDAETIEFPGAGFDTVVSSLALCTIADPVAALREMRRVCKTNGRILFLEHGRSSNRWLGRWQDLREEGRADHAGCHGNREPLDLVRRSGLRVVSSRRAFLGILHQIEATPAA
jgi:SAM-dependent methyltransferase